MPRSQNVRSTDIALVLWNRLEQVAKRLDVPTNRLVNQWLQAELNRRSRSPEHPEADGLALDDDVYRMALRSYPRRDQAAGGRHE